MPQFKSDIFSDFQTMCYALVANFLTFQNMQKLLAVENKIKSTLGPINGKSNNNGDTADNRSNLASSAGMDDRMSSCNSDYAPSSNSGSSGPYSDD